MVSTSLVCREIQAHDDDFMESTFSFVSEKKKSCQKISYCYQFTQRSKVAETWLRGRAVSIYGTREQNSNVTKGPL